MEIAKPADGRERAERMPVTASALDTALITLAGVLRRNEA